MRGLPLFAAMLLATSVAGCSTRVTVTAPEDLAPFRTWSWLPRAVPKVHAPRRQASALDAELARLIDSQLGLRGYERVDGEADFYVAYQLELRRETVLVDQPRAMYELSSHTSDGVYQVEGSERVPRTHETMNLAVGVTDASGRTLWHARLTHREEARLDLDLEAAVADLLERFPRHHPDAPAH